MRTGAGDAARQAANGRTVAVVADIMTLLALLGRARPSMHGRMLSAEDMKTTAAFVHPCCIDECRGVGTCCQMCRAFIQNIHEIVRTAYLCMFGPIHAPGHLPCPGNVFYSLPRQHIWVAHPGEDAWPSIRRWWLTHFMPVSTGFAALHGPAHQVHQQAIYRLTLREFVDHQEKVLHVDMCFFTC